MADDLPLGAILAGGRSRRFGAPKALAEIGGRPIVAWVRDALLGAVPQVVLITQEPELFTDLGLPHRPDLIPGMSALGGVHTALRWAEEEGRPGALCVACDLPFVSAALLHRLLERAAQTQAELVAPESTGPRGLEPLCTFYSVACLPEIEERLARGERALMPLLDPLRTERLPLPEVLRLGDPDLLFLNVNTPEDYRRALGLVREREIDHAGD